MVRVGANKPTKVDVRIVAATNRALLQEVGAGRFREDLFYRLAVAVLLIPPLRDREGDLGMLIEKLLDKVNAEAASEPAYKKKQLSAGARNILLQHRWPGNVRELLNTLRRLSIWSDGVTVTAADAREALLEAPTRTGQDVLGRTMGEGFDLQDLLGQVARHYLSRALEESNGNKTRAAELVGLPSYQTLTNWLGKYEVQS